ncbi:interferon-inducible GTPase 5-like [Centroberyx gerrardi]|uniref:interferon-inducible GTPase 5-like n=1 Tax=Centroberyx gerrardi TaxID=166262 RepID=UPI003AACD18D
MDNPNDHEPTEEITEALKNNDAASAAAMIQEYLEKQDNIPLNIAITGESGSGKSTFVNAFRGVDNKDERAAPTGCVETTMEVTAYPHPNYPNVTLWDLPGIGTTNFPADEYLEHVGFEKFDFFIIISTSRFTENDVKLAQEIQKMGKKFYFVRSKIDDNLRAAEKSQREFNKEKTLERIRQNCVQGLQKQGVESPKVFLISSFDLHLYDFQLLQEIMERELPAHKRNALLFAIPTINLEIVNKKKKAFQAKIKYQALNSALVAAVPIPGLSIAADLGMLVIFTTQYKNGFGLDSKSLQKLADSTHVPLSDLQAVMTSPLAANVINKELIIKVISMSATATALMAAEEGLRFIPLIGTIAAMSASYASVYKILNDCLNMLAEDAQKVLKKALGLNTSV